jgi:hypothetical protein
MTRPPVEVAEHHDKPTDSTNVSTRQNTVHQDLKPSKIDYDSKLSVSMRQERAK